VLPVVRYSSIRALPDQVFTGRAGPLGRI